jgi:hypothetical protein
MGPGGPQTPDPSPALSCTWCPVRRGANQLDASPARFRVHEGVHAGDKHAAAKGGGGVVLRPRAAPPIPSAEPPLSESVPSPTSLDQPGLLPVLEPPRL